MSVRYFSNRHYHATPRASKDEKLFRAEQLVWFTLAIVEAILLVRFGLRLLGANAGAPFAALMYSVSHLFLVPFQAILPSIREGRSVLEWGTLLAIALYWLIAWAIVKAIQVTRPVERDRIIVR